MNIPPNNAGSNKSTSRSVYLEYPKSIYTVNSNDGGYEAIGSSHISIDKHPVWMYYLIEIRQKCKMPKIN